MTQTRTAGHGAYYGMVNAFAELAMPLFKNQRVMRGAQLWAGRIRQPGEAGRRRPLSLRCCW
jgi:hypothetical protein